ncbi:hypothetical protein ABVK25_002954 [Lepraria finkii]|uniref:Uncharacterized protein n=1 Tax=Lepraria finkii TaxID=1340010 RepID=A0ABR4BFP8_9LECA
MDGPSAKDLQVFREKSRTFCGSFEIPLDKLEHEQLPKNPRQRDATNVARLLDVFHKEGCRPREPENHMLALISRSALPQARPPGGVSRGVFEEPQRLIPESPLRVLRGRHRLEAARKFLKGGDRWWVVDLYSDDLNDLVRNELREHDSNASRWFDGDIVRQIRFSTLANDPSRRDKWLARLSKSKRTCLLRLEALPGKFIESLDDLTPFAGLWPAVQIGTFPRLLKLRCPEKEVTRCLRLVKRTWTHIVGDRENDQLQLDANTVAILQGRCPFRSTEDHAFVRMRMLAGDILPAVKDNNRRSEIFDRICSIEYMILSIKTCIENSKWLEPAVRILKQLLPNNGKGSISQQFHALHNGQASLKVQTSEFTSEDRTWAFGDSFWLSYRQVFLFSLRHFPAMDSQAPRKDVATQSSPYPRKQERWWHELSSLASESGYRGLRRKYPDRKAADAKAIEDCVRSILPSKYYQIDSERMRRIVQLNCQLMSDVPYAVRMRVVPELTSDHDGCGSNISDRWGRPYDQAFEADQESLFLDYIYFSPYGNVPKRYLTTFAVKRDFFRSFFGSEEDDLDRETHVGRLFRDDVAKDEEGDDVMGDRDRITGINAGIVNPDDEDNQMAGQQLLTSGNLPNTKEENESQLQTSEPLPPTVEFGQQNHDKVVSFTEASRLLSRTQRDGRKRLFTVLSPMADNTFRKHQADSLDATSMVTALELPSDARFIARDENERLKMTAPTTILDAARSEQLHTVLRVKQPNIQALIRRFEDHKEPEDELDDIE